MDEIRILLAEDDPDHQKLMLLSLRGASEQARVTAVSTRDELLQAAASSQFDCILLDYNIPPYTAVEVMRDLDTLQAGVPRIVISSSEAQHVVVNSLRSGVDDFVHKDDATEGTTLWDRVMTAIRAKRLQHEDRRSLCRMLQSLEHVAHHDTLTGLLNRAGLEAAISPTAQRLERRGHQSLTFVDLDHFKQVNDTLGHKVGDEVLKATAGVISRMVGNSGICGRWGGEEFLVLRHTVSPVECWCWADDLRRAIQREVCRPNPLGPQTASIGVELLLGERISPEAVSRADRAMYLAKQLGRNRVCTTDMVAAYEAATQEHERTPHDTRRCLHRLREHLRGRLGEVQLEHTGPHGERVRQLAMLVAEMMTGGRDNLPDLSLAAEFHDIGKLGLPECLLALPRSLDQRERRYVDEHARFGADLLKACGANDNTVNAVLNHHVRHDESRERQADDSPPSDAEIISACDATVTMLSVRPYSARRSLKNVLSELSRHSGKQFHPEVVSAIHRASTRGTLAA